MNSTFAPVMKSVRTAVVVIAAAAALMGAATAEAATHPQQAPTVRADGGSTDDTNPWS
ncbi:hypothetical protein [Streptomyces shenzhenensis]|uniref:hypothetical protein n=1 Tax=Streptomyces TaxID=1883 RepID=UPI001F38681D|nr:hypothetical protein [Streptomyces shenzhenensis]